jgi:hypothetical protein
MIDYRLVSLVRVVLMMHESTIDRFIANSHHLLKVYIAVLLGGPCDM